MLREDGYVFDDGIVARLAPDRFHVTTTTGGAARVLRYMEDYLQTEWPRSAGLSDLDHRAIRGHRGAGAEGARAAAPLVGHRPADAGDAAHGRARRPLCGIPCRLFRVSFTGELGYEINVPWGDGARCGRCSASAARRSASRPTAPRAMHVLRAEKGFIIVGQETDGTVTPARSRPWPDDRQGETRLRRQALAGRPDLRRAGAQAARRPADRRRALVLEEGAQIVADPRALPMSARPRHLELLQRQLRPLDRDGAARGRPGALARPCTPPFQAALPRQKW